MFKRPDAIALRKQEFYREYAMQNQVDCLQLKLLDLLYDAGGKATWLMVFEQIPEPRHQIEQAAADLEDQELVAADFDRILLTDYAPFVVDEILNDFHEQLQHYLSQFPDTDSASARFLA